jgi:hypothetical protein
MRFKQIIPPSPFFRLNYLRPLFPAPDRFSCTCRPCTEMEA